MSMQRKLYCSDCLQTWCRARLQCSTDICWQFWRIWDAFGTSSHGTFQRHIVSQETSTRLTVMYTGFSYVGIFFQATIRSTSGFLKLHLLFGIHVLSLSTLSPPSCTCIVRFQSMWHCSPKSKIPGFFTTFFTWTVTFRPSVSYILSRHENPPAEGRVGAQKRQWSGATLSDNGQVFGRVPPQGRCGPWWVLCLSLSTVHFPHVSAGRRVQKDYNRTRLPSLEPKTSLVALSLLNFYIALRIDCHPETYVCIG